MLKIGLLVGKERSFPDALITEINGRGQNIHAEYVSTAEVHSDAPGVYDVILDRISHEVVFYQAFLKRAVLSGTTVINNPFWRLADDKFFGTALLQKMGIAVPKTLILPSHSYPESISTESLRNLKHPIDWNAVVAYTGLPAILKPHWGGGWKDVHRIDSIDQLLSVYNSTGLLCMMLQEFIEWQNYVRCICVGKKNILITNWDPRKSHFERYRGVEQNLDQDLQKRIESEAILINEALGYDMNTIEFAVRDGIPYAIDFMNSAPDFDISSLTENYFPWVVKNMADMLIERAGEPKQIPTKWNNFL
jgi:glutathione synthase/RimK-type ligase-like ATP-grasp enzyme